MEEPAFLGYPSRVFEGMTQSGIDPGSHKLDNQPPWFGYEIRRAPERPEWFIPEPNGMFMDI
jgi:hypothetical protein